MIESTWKVYRHGGRSTDDWHVIGFGDEAQARKIYNRAYGAMRQGGVRLFNPDGKMILGSWAPRLRTRW